MPLTKTLKTCGTHLKKLTKHPKVNPDMEKMIFFQIEKCPQIHVFPNHIKVTQIEIFSITLDIFKQKYINCG